MRIKERHLDEIDYIYTPYSHSLKESVKRIGFSIPIKVKEIDGKLVCVDGHKRLSILHDILVEDPEYKRGDIVRVIYVDNGDTRSNDSWRGRNTH